MIRNCYNCKQDFKTDNRNAKFCNRDCRFPLRHSIKNCKECNKGFHPKSAKIEYCSHQCSVGKTRKQKETKLVHLICKQCKQPFTKLAYNHKQRPYQFCSRKCSAKGKTVTKSRRSQHEKLLYELLVQRFSQLTIINNNRTIFEGLEIDIWIPELKLAIEWNGIVHYKPIYGEETLFRVQNNDNKKQILANKLDIRLIIIPQTNRMSNKKFAAIFENVRIIIEQLLTLQEKLHAQSGIHGNA